MIHVWKSSLLISMLLVANPALAEDNNAVMKKLEAMQEQMLKLQQEVKSLQTELTLAKEKASTAEQKAVVAEKAATDAKALSALKPAAGASKPTMTGSDTSSIAVTSDSDVKFSLAPGPKFETADGAYSFKLGGFAQVDGGIFNDDRRDHPDGTNIRRARLSASGTIAHDFKYKLENDFANNASAITDAYLEYVGLEPFSIMVGQFKEPFGLEVLTSDLFTTFMERASIFAFAPDRNIGVAVGANGTTDIGAWTATIGGFGAGTGVASSDDEARDITGRLTYAPIAEKDKVIHLGVAASHRIPDSATDSIRIQSRAENRLSSVQAVDTGILAGTDNVDLLGLEAAAVWGPASVQGEYVLADYDRSGALAEGTLDGYYVEASYFLTGESRAYIPSSGRFDRVKPKEPFSLKNGTWGAWQIAARYSDLDLNDGGISGGELKDATFAIKWLPLANVMVTGNYIRSNTDANSVTPNDDPEIWMLRTQFDF